MIFYKDAWHNLSSTEMGGKGVECFLVRPWYEENSSLFDSTGVSVRLA